MIIIDPIKDEENFAMKYNAEIKHEIFRHKLQKS
jgi:hypothetical protein